MSVWSSIKSTVNEAVDKVASSNYLKNVKMTVSELNDSLSYLASKDKLRKAPIIGMNLADVGVGSEGVKKSIGEAMEDLSGKLNGKKLKKAQELYKSKKWDTPDELAFQMQDILGKDSAIYKNFVNQMHDIALNAKVPADEVRNTIGGINYVFNAPKAYFNPVDASGNINKSARKARIATAAGAYVGINVGGRYLQGGTLTRDDYGQRDIAGIPFV